MENDSKRIEPNDNVTLEHDVKKSNTFNCDKEKSFSCLYNQTNELSIKRTSSTCNCKTCKNKL